MFSAMNTETLEEVGGRGEQQVVAHRFRIRARRDARLEVVLLDPVRQPLEVAVAEERVVAQTAATSDALIKFSASSSKPFEALGKHH